MGLNQGSGEFKIVRDKYYWTLISDFHGEPCMIVVDENGDSREEKYIVSVAWAEYERCKKYANVRV